METHQQFPSHNDIYSIYKAPFIKKEGKKKKIIKLLPTLLKTYPDLNKFVTENSLSKEYLHKLLREIITKMIKLEKSQPKSSEDLFQIPFVPRLCDSHDKGNVEQIAETPIQDSQPSLNEQQPQSQPQLQPQSPQPQSPQPQPPQSQSPPQLLPQPQPQPQPPQSPPQLSPQPQPPQSPQSPPQSPPQSQSSPPQSQSQSQSSCNEVNPRTFCVANIWSGFPTFGSIYSTSKLVQQQKGDDKEFVLAMLKILMKKYPRLKTIFSDLYKSHSITETLLYILKQADKLEQSSCKQERRRFFSSIFNLENISIISNYLKDKTGVDHSHNDIENVPDVSDMDENKTELTENLTTDESSSVCVDKSSIEFHLDSESEFPISHTKSENEENKTDLYEYLKTLKSKYDWTQSELAKKRKLEINLEKKLKHLLTNQRKYKCKIKRCRKEMTELDTYKSVCRSQAQK